MFTVQCRLDARGETPEIREAIRRCIWEFMAETYTLLVNELISEVAEHPAFETWQQKGSLDSNALKALWKSLKEEPRFKGLPDRLLVSARLMVHYTYDAWLALNQKKQTKLDNNIRWVEVVKSDAELLQISGCNLDTIRAKAKELLAQINTQSQTQHTTDRRVRKRKVGNSSTANQATSQSMPDAKQKSNMRGEENNKSNTTKTNYQTLDALFNAYYATDDTLQKCAIAYLIKNKRQVNDKEEDLKKLTRLIKQKKKKIERLQKQLESRIPKGRQWLGNDFIDNLKAFGIPESEVEWFSLQSALIGEHNFLPYPILFGSSDDLIWSKQLKISNNPNLIKENLESEKSRERICVQFKGLKEVIFEISCDRRQLPLFQQFLKDWTIYSQNPKEHTSSLFLIRSATLIWKDTKKTKNRQKRWNKNKSVNQKCIDPQQEELKQLVQAGINEEEQPWNRYQLFLHCTVATEFLSKEGTQQLGQKKQELALKAIATLEQKILELEKEGKSTKNDRESFSRKQGTVRRLNNLDNPFERPSRPLYQAQPNILLGVSLGSSKLATATVVDVTTEKVLECQGVRRLLGDNYKLLTRKRYLHEMHSHLRSKAQKRGAKNLLREAKLGEHIDRLIATAIIALARKYQASTIVLPDMKDYTEKKQSEIEAFAEQECSGWKCVEKRFTKAQSVKLHRWSYSRLSKIICQQASKVGIAVEIGQQPIHGSSQEQSRAMAIETYHSRKNSLKSKNLRS
jgi:hypothetical protein